MQSYVAERLRVAGANGTPIFSIEAVDAVYRHSGGIPRIANLLCEHALINGFADEIRPIPSRIVEEVSHEFELQKAELAARNFVLPEANQDELVDAVVRKLQELVDRVEKSNDKRIAADDARAAQKPSTTPEFPRH